MSHPPPQRDFQSGLQQGHRVRGAAATKRANQPKVEPDLEAALVRLRAFLNDRAAKDTTDPQIDAQEPTEGQENGEENP